MEAPTDYQKLMKRVAFDQVKTKVVINGFDAETAPLTVDEFAICTYMVSRLQKNTGAANAATSSKIIAGVKAALGVKFTGARLRKIVNHIRRNDLLPGLVASSKGYYVETEAEKIKEYIESLRQRAAAINAVADAMQRDLNQLKIFNPYVRTEQQPEPAGRIAEDCAPGPAGSPNAAECGSGSTDCPGEPGNAATSPENAPPNKGDGVQCGEVEGESCI